MKRPWLSILQLSEGPATVPFVIGEQKGAELENWDELYEPLRDKHLTKETLLYNWNELLNAELPYQMQGQLIRMERIDAYRQLLYVKDRLGIVGTTILAVTSVDVKVGDVIRIEVVDIKPVEGIPEVSLKLSQVSQVALATTAQLITKKDVEYHSGQDIVFTPVSVGKNERITLKVVLRQANMLCLLDANQQRLQIHLEPEWYRVESFDPGTILILGNVNITELNRHPKDIGGWFKISLTRTTTVEVIQDCQHPPDHNKDDALPINELMELIDSMPKESTQLFELVGHITRCTISRKRCISCRPRDTTIKDCSNCFQNDHFTASLDISDSSGTWKHFVIPHHLMNTLFGTLWIEDYPNQSDIQREALRMGILFQKFKFRVRASCSVSGRTSIIVLSLRPTLKN